MSENTFFGGLIALLVIIGLALFLLAEAGGRQRRAVCVAHSYDYAYIEAAGSYEAECHTWESDEPQAALVFNDGIWTLDQ